MPPKRAAVNLNHQGPTKKSKVKFSATMPEFEDKSNDSNDQESQSKEESLDQNSDSLQENSNEMEVSEQSSQSNKQKKHNKKIERSKDEEDSQEQSESDPEEQSSSSQQVETQQNKNPKTPPPVQQVSAQQDENIPQQQVETDDIDSNYDREIHVFYENGRETRIQEERKIDTGPIRENKKTDTKTNKMEQSESEIFVPLKKDPVQLKQDNKMEIENSVKPQQKNQSIEQYHKMDQEQSPEKKNKKQKKDKKEKKDKKSKKKHKKSKDQQQMVLEQPAEQKRQSPQADKQTDEQFPDYPEQNHTFYEYLHPYLMIVGTAVIESFMSSKSVYKPDEASSWGSQLSQKVLLKAYMDDVDGLQEFQEEEEDEDEAEKQKKEKIIQTKIQNHKFFKKVQTELDQLAGQKQINKFSLAKIFLLIQKFKLIASCIIMEKKPKYPSTVNINTSSYWNKQKDGQINFSYDGTSLFAMLTLYGVINEKKNGQRNE